MKRHSHCFPAVIAFVLLQFFFTSALTGAPSSAQQGVKPLTIEEIFTPGVITGRGPETMEWSPDGSKLSYVQRDDKGEQGELWYADAATGEKKVLVPPDTPIVSFVAGDRSELKPGARIIIFSAARKEDGTLEAARVNVGRDGITPPM